MIKICPMERDGAFLCRYNAIGKNAILLFMNDNFFLAPRNDAFVVFRKCDIISDRE
jgi:hypothetical protein